MGKNKHETNPDILEAIGIFLQGYEPAVRETEADHFLSTQEIRDAIEMHTGLPVSFSEIFQVLRLNGFHYARRGGAGLYWMFTDEKPSSFP